MLFPKPEVHIFKEIFATNQPKLTSINYLMLNNLLPIAGHTYCGLCKWEYESRDHLLFECKFFSTVRFHVKDWLSKLENRPFNRERIIGMKDVKDDLENQIISHYILAVWKYRNINQVRKLENDIIILKNLYKEINFFTRQFNDIH